jgi:acyl-CoA synthetase (AMP-forming)/AMP-acid ligase II
MFGIWATGLVAVPINAKLHAREVTDIRKRRPHATCFNGRLTA